MTSQRADCQNPVCLRAKLVKKRSKQKETRNFCTIHSNRSVADSLIHRFTELKTGCAQSVVLPFGHSLLQLPQQVLVELVELRQVVQDLVEETLLDHRLAVLTRRSGHSAAEVLQGQRTPLTTRDTRETLKRIST